MEGQMLGQKAEAYLTYNASTFLGQTFAYFKELRHREACGQRVLEARIPDDDASPSEKLFFVLLSVDAHFLSMVILKEVTTHTDHSACLIAAYKVPSIVATGEGFGKLVVTMDDIMLAKVERKDFIKAHALQLGALYTFNIGTSKKDGAKELPPAVGHFFEFVSVFLWQIPKLKCINKKIKQVAPSAPVLELWNRIRNKIHN